MLVNIAVGFLVGGVICVAILALVRDRAMRLTTRQLEADFQQSLAELRANKDLLQNLRTIVEQVTVQMVQLGKKEDAINQLRDDHGALKLEVGALRSELEAISTAKMTEHATLMPVTPTISQEVLEDTWLRGNNRARSRQNDMWSRKRPANEPTLIPTSDQSNSSDTWTRDVSEGELAALLGFSANGFIAHANQREIAPKEGDLANGKAQEK